jgi:hypothetical protein
MNGDGRKEVPVKACLKMKTKKEKSFQPKRGKASTRNCRGPQRQVRRVVSTCHLESVTKAVLWMLRSAGKKFHCMRSGASKNDKNNKHNLVIKNPEGNIPQPTLCPDKKRCCQMRSKNGQVAAPSTGCPIQYQPLVRL